MPKNGDTVWFLDFNDTPTEGFVVGVYNENGRAGYRIKYGDRIFSLEDYLVFQSSSDALQNALDWLEQDTAELVERLHSLEAKAQRLRGFIGD